MENNIQELLEEAKQLQASMDISAGVDIDDLNTLNTKLEKLFDKTNDLFEKTITKTIKDIENEQSPTDL